MRQKGVGIVGSSGRGKVMISKEDPKKFIKELLEKPKDDILYKAIVKKLGKR